MTRILTVIIIILAAVLVGIILYPQIQENRPMPLRFACDSSVAALPFLVAVDDTLFLKNRILPELTYYSDPDQALTDLFAGKTDVGVFPWSTILKHMSTKGETLQVFMAVEFRPALPVDVLAKVKKSRINKLTDLKGKRLGYPPILRDYVAALLGEIGLKPADVKLTEASLTALSAMLTAGQLDAAWLVEPAVCPLNLNNVDTLSSIATRYLNNPFPAFAIGFSPQFLKNTTRAQRTRLKIALDMAVDRIDARPEEGKQTLGRYFPYCRDVCGFCRLPQYQRLVEINRPAIQTLAARLLRLGIVSDTIDTKRIFVEPAQMMR
ncbi:MAG: ABC transporter substrate-binding protein [candidate division WOR-3 bacterium]|uniref:SsuA/THI5-like domain-containing protein n=1 Tax=candidate division WOR-3 bacterium TaxID=2052148 RepID=A0A7C1SJJ5_UNCW3|nr:ABC transporter substrate-binding protein [candidate division WOR-3 bacterium]